MILTLFKIKNHCQAQPTDKLHFPWGPWVVCPRCRCFVHCQGAGGGGRRQWGTPRAAPLSPAPPQSQTGSCHDCDGHITGQDSWVWVIAAPKGRLGEQRILRGTGGFGLPSVPALGITLFTTLPPFKTVKRRVKNLQPHIGLFGIQGG